MIATLQNWADKEKDECRKLHHLRSIESVARQINDAKVFEKARIAKTDGASGQNMRGANHEER